MATQLRAELSQRLRSRYQAEASPDWLWFEDTVTYDNARLPHALILTGRWASEHELLEIGLRSLRWLFENETAPEGHFRPVGSNGFWKRGEQPALFEQQPIEAHAMICASRGLRSHRRSLLALPSQQSFRVVSWRERPGTRALRRPERRLQRRLAYRPGQSESRRRVDTCFSAVSSRDAPRTRCDVQFGTIAIARRTFGSSHGIRSRRVPCV